MRQTPRGAAAACIVFTLIASALCLVPRTRAEPREESNAASIEQGREIFRNESFDGNGRTCATCHRPDDEFALRPESVERAFARDPSGPLFRAIDSDDGDGRSFDILRQHAVIRVTLPLHDDVWLVDNPTRRFIEVWRGVPSVSNVALSAPYQQDGRIGTLQVQAAAAVEEHFEPRRAPRSKELDSLALYQRSLFYPLRLEHLVDAADPVVHAPDFSIPVEGPAARRGRTLFDRHCRVCHGGETLGRPTDPHQPLFDTVGISETNRNGFPLLRLAFRNRDGSVTEIDTPDPGRAAGTGRLLDLHRFDTPPLRGLKHTAPYFHDNSAKTLGEMVDHYDGFLGLNLTAAQKNDLIAFLELL